jgi:hypothetical protein
LLGVLVLPVDNRGDDLQTMQIKEYIPTLLIVIHIAAAVVCIWEGDKARFLYWISAALITFSTLLIK